MTPATYSAAVICRSAARRLGWFALAWVLYWPLTAQALSDPLTLEEVLAMADLPHPDLELAQAGVEGAQAEFEQARSGSGVPRRYAAQISGMPSATRRSASE